MSVSTEPPAPFGSGHEVWDFLRTSAGLHTDLSDTQLVQDLRTALPLPASGAVHKLLLEQRVSAPRFLDAFFTAFSPYVVMLNELLAMFDRAAAQQGVYKLSIQFDFGADRPGLTFDLTELKRWHRRWNELHKVFSQVDSSSRTKLDYRQSLDEFLVLPLWTHRHELYRAWVSTQFA